MEVVYHRKRRKREKKDAQNKKQLISLLISWANRAAPIRTKFGVNARGRGTHSAHTLRLTPLAFTMLTRRGSEFSLSVQWVRLSTPGTCRWTRGRPEGHEDFPWWPVPRRYLSENTPENKRSQQVTNIPFRYSVAVLLYWCYLIFDI